jgi:DeoR/GlpR family transcriptional regulator of sugar metabolism
VTVEQLARALKVSPVTVRADLSELERRGRLVRVHGGAMAANIFCTRSLDLSTGILSFPVL